MENNIDFIELADYCQQQAKEKCKSLGSIYRKTYYCAISEDDHVLVSSTPHILKDAFQCILVHMASTPSVGNIWYPSIQHINNIGCVSDGQLDTKYSIPAVEKSYSRYRDRMSLFLGNERIFTCLPPIETAIPTIWSLYQKCKECSTNQEAILLCKLAEADQKILELERDNQGLTYQNEMLEKINKKYENILQKIEEALPKE